MIRTNNLDELLKIVEGIRGKKYPTIPAALVEKIIKTEAEFQDSRADASERVKMLVEEYLAKK